MNLRECSVFLGQSRAELNGSDVRNISIFYCITLLSKYCKLTEGGTFLLGNWQATLLMVESELPALGLNWKSPFLVCIAADCRKIIFQSCAKPMTSWENICSAHMLISMQTLTFCWMWHDAVTVNCHIVIGCNFDTTECLHILVSTYHRGDLDYMATHKSKKPP